MESDKRVFLGMKNNGADCVVMDQTLGEGERVKISGKGAVRELQLLEK